MRKDKALSLYDKLDVADEDNAAHIQQIYQRWASEYDRDNDEALGTVSQPTMVSLFGLFAENKQMHLLDVGCGTGLVGLHLRQAGFTNYDGTDLSQDMMAHAEDRGYQRLFTGNLAQGLAVRDETYDGCLCVGVFTHGHVGPDGLHELTRITKIDGLIGFTVNEDIYLEYEFDKAIATWAEGGIWDIKLHQTTDYMTKKEVKGIYVIAKRCQ